MLLAPSIKEGTDGSAGVVTRDREPEVDGLATAIRLGRDMSHVEEPNVPGMTAQQPPINVFLSYAHEDEPLLRQLETHLSLLKRQGVISTWYDRQIVPGTNRAEVIDQRLEHASLILLLVSADFLASDYCYQVEMMRALERHEAGEAHVIPIVVRPCDWSHAPFAKLHYLPRDGKAITTWHNQDLAWNNVIAGIRQVIDALHVSSRRTSYDSGCDEEPAQPSQQHMPAQQAHSAPQQIGTSFSLRSKTTKAGVTIVTVLCVLSVIVVLLGTLALHVFGPPQFPIPLNGKKQPNERTQLHGKWIIAPDQTLGRSDNFNDISASSADSIWAVGKFGLFSTSGQVGGGFMAHWIGDHWQMVASPKPTPQGDEMDAVDSLAANDVWAIGTYTCVCTGFRAIMDHWDGTSWKMYRGPNPTNWNTYFTAAAGSASNDVWAVGSYNTNIATAITQPLFEHWDGRQWKIIASPRIVSSGNNLTESGISGIAVISAHDAWAIGNGGGKPLLEHWDGNTWKLVAVTYPSGLTNAATVVFNGITHIPDTDHLWIVGAYTTGPRTLVHTLTEAYDGTKWTVIPSPDVSQKDSVLLSDVSQKDSVLLSVSALSPDSAWAVGYQGTYNLNQAKTLIEYWDGAAWMVVPSPDPSTQQNHLLARVVQVPGTTQALAVGTNNYANGVGGFASFSEWYRE